LAQDISEVDAYGESTVWDGVKMAVRDYRLYLFVLLQHVSLVSQTFQYFFPTIVGTLGYGKITTLWLTAPAWVRNHFPSPLQNRSLILLFLTVRYVPPIGLRHVELCQNER
jgi:hypothetical protein